MRPMSMIYYSEDKAKRYSDDKTAFVIKPLERGFASTIGIALRRTILSSITSATSFAIKIKGVEHEFTTIKGVTEDVQNIILNVREINFLYSENVFEDHKIYRGKLSVNGPKVVRAGDFVFDNPAIEIFNKDQEIATVSADANLTMEIFLISGRGFTDFEENKNFIAQRQTEINSEIKKGNLIAIDSDFSPVKSVRIKSTEINSSSKYIEEQLEIEIESKGRVTAKDIISQASQILIAHFQIIGDTNNLGKINIFEEGIKIKSDANNHINKDIKDLGLSVRSINALQKQGYTKLGDIANLTEDDLASVKNLGKKSVTEIIDLMKEFNININKGDE